MRSESKAGLVILVAVIVIGAALYSVYGLPGGTNQSTNTTTPSSQSGSGSYTLAVADPPSGGSGTNREYTHYSHPQAHRADSPPDQGWVDIGAGAQGTVEFISHENTSTTIASSQVAAGTFDSVRFTIDSVIVTYSGANYTASMPSSVVTAKLDQSSTVNSGGSAVALIAIHSLIVNVGSSGSPSFVVGAQARATTVPSSESSAISSTVGATTSLSGMSIWTSLLAESTSRLQITSASITSATGNFTVRVADTSGSNDTVRLIVISAASSSGTANSTLALGSGTALFLVSSSGTLSSTATLGAQALLGGSGFSLASGSSATYSASGLLNIQIGIITGFQAGAKYQVTVIGDGSTATTVVTAG